MPSGLFQLCGGVALPLWLAVGWAALAAASDDPFEAAPAKPVEQPVAAAEADQPGPPPPRRVALVRLKLPIAGNDDSVYQARLERAADRLLEDPADDRRPLLVIEFDPATEGGATEFERALRLARFLVGDRMTRVKTLAYLPRPVRGHAALVALACEEVAMAPDAVLGSAGADDDPARPVEAGVRASYEQIADARRTAPRAVAVAMVDRAAELVRVESDRGVEYALGEDLPSLREERAVVREEVLSPAGSLAEFTGREAREGGFAKYLAADRDALAQALSVPAAALLEDQSLAGDWRPVMVDLAGPVTQRVVRRIESLVGDELQRNRVNWVGVRIDSSGGDLPAALRLAQTLAELGGGEVRTVAYVPARAEGPAALVALACDQLVMQRGATLTGVAPERTDDDPADADAEAEPRGDNAAGDAAPEDNGDNDNDNGDNADPPGRLLGLRRLAADPAGELDAARRTVREVLAPATPRGWSLLAAAIDPAVEVLRWSNRQTGATALMSPDEVAERDDADQWRRGERVKPPGEALSLTAERAEELGVAWHTVEQFDDLQPLYGFAEPPRTAEPNWALELVEALASPGLAALLLVVGIVGLYIEFNTPGMGFGGFVATVALLLFFWSKFLDGTADWLEVLLFVAGLVFVMIEVLLLPGLGIFGFGGALMVVAALVLASQTFVLPKTEGQLVELRNSLATVTGAGLGFLVLAGGLRHYLPQSPLFRWAMLAPAEKADRIEQGRREQIADYTHLVGRTGVATTPLLPGGRAEVDGEPVDVVTRGEVIDRGDPIEVVEAHANRVVVRRAPS